MNFIYSIEATIATTCLLLFIYSANKHEFGCDYVNCPVRLCVERQFFLLLLSVGVLN
jgi:hypothetical protein